jgi:uncharacterized protein (UPF0332 family)
MRMSFEAFVKKSLRQGLIKEQEKSFKGMEKMIKRAYEEIDAAKKNMEVDQGVAFTVAYTAMLHTGRALMLFKGYRPSDGYQHKTVVDFAANLLGEKYKTLTQRFDSMRRKRNIFTYELSISFSETEVKDALESAESFIKTVRDTIEAEDPQHRFKF